MISTAGCVMSLMRCPAKQFQAEPNMCPCFLPGAHTSIAQGGWDLARQILSLHTAAHENERGLQEQWSSSEVEGPNGAYTDAGRGIKNGAPAQSLRQKWCINRCIKEQEHQRLSYSRSEAQVVHQQNVFCPYRSLISPGHV